MLSRLLHKEKGNLTLVIGNGINRYNSSNDNGSWDSLLIQLWNRYSNSQSDSVPKGITFTEFYDAIDLKMTDKSSLQKEFCDLMSDWRFEEHHYNIANWALNNNCQILTTNFERTLSESLNCKLFHIDSKHFTDYYPWSSYYSLNDKEPMDGFGIWHINGMQNYSRSIRLGLSHYMGSVEKSRAMMHKGGEKRLFSKNNIDKWRGNQTWLHFIFTKPLLFIGLGLDSTEVFLRWLLVERAKLFKKFPDLYQPAWYVYAGNNIREGHELFLDSVGISVIKIDNFDSIYHEPWV